MEIFIRGEIEGYCYARSMEKKYFFFRPVGDIYFSAAILALFSSSACFISDRWNRRKLGTAINRRSEGFLRKPISRESRLDREKERRRSSDRFRPTQAYFVI